MLSLSCYAFLLFDNLKFWLFYHTRTFVRTYIYACILIFSYQTSSYELYFIPLLSIIHSEKKKIETFFNSIQIIIWHTQFNIKKKNYDCYHVHIDVFISCFLVVETCIHMYVHTYLSYVLRMVNIWFYFQPFNYRSRQSTTFRYNK